MTHPANRSHEELKALRPKKQKAKKDVVVLTCIKCNKPYSIPGCTARDYERRGMKPNPMCKTCQREIASRAHKAVKEFHQSKEAIVYESS